MDLEIKAKVIAVPVGETTDHERVLVLARTIDEFVKSQGKNTLATDTFQTSTAKHSTRMTSAKYLFGTVFYHGSDEAGKQVDIVEEESLGLQDKRKSYFLLGRRVEKGPAREVDRYLNDVIRDEARMLKDEKRGTVDSRARGCAMTATDMFLYRVFFYENAETEEVVAEVPILELPRRKVSSIDEIVSSVEKYYALQRGTLAGNNRGSEYVRARQIAAFILHNEFSQGLSAIGRMFHKDHTTITYYLGQFDSNTYVPGATDVREMITRASRAMATHSAKSVLTFPTIA